MRNDKVQSFAFILNRSKFIFKETCIQAEITCIYISNIQVNSISIAFEDICISFSVRCTFRSKQINKLIWINILAIQKCFASNLNKFLAIHKCYAFILDKSIKIYISVIAFKMKIQENASVCIFTHSTFRKDFQNFADFERISKTHLDPTFF